MKKISSLTSTKDKSNKKIIKDVQVVFRKYKSTGSAIDPDEGDYEDRMAIVTLQMYRLSQLRDKANLDIKNLRYFESQLKRLLNNLENRFKINSTK